MIDHFSRWAEWYDRLLGPPDTERLANLLKLPAKGILLDLGGGTGRVSSRLRNMIDHVLVCDLSRKMLKKGREKKLDVLVGAAERLPFGRAAFDRVLVVDSFHHFADHRAAVNNMVRVLKPGGTIVVEEPDIHHPLVKIAAMMEKALRMQSLFFKPEAIRTMLRGHGLQTDIIRDHRHTAWVVATCRRR
jgi:ubiquinone/menaquinone biosynthesis C-methylase UbiE